MKIEIMKQTTVFILLFVTLLSNSARSQCGTVVTDEQAKMMEEAQPRLRSFNNKITRGVIDVPVQLHVLRKSNRKGAIQKYRIQEAISDLNSHFINANIRFVVLDKINYIDDNRLYDFDVKYEEELGRDNDVKNVINLYIVNSISSGQISLCGYAYFPPGNDRVLMSKSCINNGSTLPHEMGHYFMLYHTHGISNNGSTDELADESNCHIAGDRVCDTPADPNISGYVDDNCRYTGKMKDPKKDYYEPDPLNMMSYSTKPCRQRFTKGQFTRINYAAINHRQYLEFPKEDVEVEAPSDVLALSGSLMLEIGGKPLPTALDINLFKSTEGYYKGTNYQLYLSNKQTVYVYVIGSNLENESNLLFPLENQSALVFKGKEKFALPGDDYMYQMDDMKGMDYLCVLYSRRPLQINNVMDDLKNVKGNFMQRLYKTLGSKLVPLNEVNYKKEESIAFSAVAKNNYIIPIVVEIEHL
jgi:hypothetical protein